MRTTILTDDFIQVVKEAINEIEIKYNYEKNLKNQAYYFILENGYLDDFAEYSRKNPVGQNHQEKIYSFNDGKKQARFN